MLIHQSGYQQVSVEINITQSEEYFENQSTNSFLRRAQWNPKALPQQHYHLLAKRRGGLSRFQSY